MKNKKCAVISCLGLGDGLLALVLSNNLALNGAKVDTYHPFLNQMQLWFSHLPIRAFPYDSTESFVDMYDFFFFIYDQKMQSVIDACLKRCLDSTFVLNPIATAHCDYPYWEQGRFDGRLPFAQNLMHFCKNVLHLEKVTCENGIRNNTNGSVSRKYSHRVVIHPTSSRKSKNWSWSKFIAFSDRLKKDGYEPVWILTKEEQSVKPSDVVAPEFAHLSDTAAFIAESGYMMGNDSGIGHLASCLGVPTLTICRHKMVADFWRPSWSKGEVVLPPSWIPNLKGMRFRDKHWQKFVSVDRVYKRFLHLAGSDAFMRKELS